MEDSNRAPSFSLWHHPLEWLIFSGSALPTPLTWWTLILPGLINLPFSLSFLLPVARVPGAFLPVLSYLPQGHGLDDHIPHVAFKC